MIARIWHGTVPLSKGDEYLALMRKIALPDYIATRGNRAAYCLHRTQDDAKHFQMLTFWDDIEAIKRFAGEDYNLAKYYDFDASFLLEMEPHVSHYEMNSNGASSFLKTGLAAGRGGENMIARLWRGVVAAENAEAYWRYLMDFGVRDYRGCDGNDAVFVLRQNAEVRVHFLLLSFWKSRQAIAAYAGADIEQARYYRFDLERLIDPAQRVEHYEVCSAGSRQA